MNQKHVPQWQPVKRFLDEGTNIVIEVTQDVANKFPRFSISIGREGKDPGTVLRHISVMTERSGDLKEPSPSESVGKLLKAAEEFIVGEAKRMEDKLSLERERRKERQQKFEGPKPKQEVMRKGKTARERDKRKARRESKASDGF